MAICTDCKKLWEKVSRMKSNRCPPCQRVWNREYLARRKAAGRPVVSEPMPPGYHQAYGRTYCQQPVVKQRKAKQAAARRRDPNHHQRIYARMSVRNAVRRGEINKPQECSACGRLGKISAHHDDYSRPLDVVWLCRDCHEKADAKIKGTT